MVAILPIIIGVLVAQFALVVSIDTPNPSGHATAIFTGFGSGVVAAWAIRVYAGRTNSTNVVLFSTALPGKYGHHSSLVILSTSVFHPKIIRSLDVYRPELKALAVTTRMLYTQPVCLPGELSDRVRNNSFRSIDLYGRKAGLTVTTMNKVLWVPRHLPRLVAHAGSGAIVSVDLYRPHLSVTAPLSGVDQEYARPSPFVYALVTVCMILMRHFVHWYTMTTPTSHGEPVSGGTGHLVGRVDPSTAPLLESDDNLESTEDSTSLLVPRDNERQDTEYDTHVGSFAIGLPRLDVTTLDDSLFSTDILEHGKSIGNLAASNRSVQCDHGVANMSLNDDILRELHDAVQENPLGNPIDLDAEDDIEYGSMTLIEQPYIQPTGELAATPVETCTTGLASPDSAAPIHGTRHSNEAGGLDTDVNDETNYKQIVPSPSGFASLMDLSLPYAEGSLAGVSMDFVDPRSPLATIAEEEGLDSDMDARDEECSMNVRSLLWPYEPLTAVKLPTDGTMDETANVSLESRLLDISLASLRGLTDTMDLTMDDLASPTKASSGRDNDDRASLRLVLGAPTHSMDPTTPEPPLARLRRPALVSRPPSLSTVSEEHSSLAMDTNVETRADDPPLCARCGGSLGSRDIGKSTQATLDIGSPSQDLDKKLGRSNLAHGVLDLSLCERKAAENRATILEPVRNSSARDENPALSED